MTEFYDIITDLKTALIAQPFVNTVTTGGLEDVDLNKKTIFPLSHIIVNSAVPKSNTVSFNISIIAMDIVDESKETTTNIFVGNDNEQDVLNTQFQVLNQVYQQMLHGQLFSELIQIIGDPNCEPFTDRFENKLAGWTMTFDVEIPNEMTICGTAIPPHCADAFIQNSDGTFTANIPSGTSLYLEDVNIQVFDQFEQELANINIPSNVNRQITVVVPPCENATIHNSDNSFTQSLASGSDTPLEDITLKFFNSIGNNISGQTLPSNIDFNPIIPDTEINLVNQDLDLISTTSVPSGVTNQIIAPNGTVTVKKSDFTVIANVDVAPAGTNNVVITDSVAVLKDSAGTTISTTNIKAQNTQNITAPDGVVTIKKSNGTTIQTQSVKSNGTANSTVSDSVITLKDSSSTTISTTNVKATDAQNITAPDATIQINNRTFGTAKSNETKNFSLTTAKLMATGQTTSYATGDDGNMQRGRIFTTLLENNPFGNTNRFTALNGTQTYLNDIVLDWSTWDGQTVLGYYRLINGNGTVLTKTWATAISESNALSISVYTSGWRLVNRNELNNLCNTELSIPLNYAPLNISAVTQIWSGTTLKSITTQAYRLSNVNGNINSVDKASTTGTGWLACRNFTNAELGI